MRILASLVVASVKATAVYALITFVLLFIFSGDLSIDAALAYGRASLNAFWGLLLSLPVFLIAAPLCAFLLKNGKWTRKHLMLGGMMIGGGYGMFWAALFAAIFHTALGLIPLFSGILAGLLTGFFVYGDAAVLLNALNPGKEKTSA